MRWDMMDVRCWSLLGNLTVLATRSRERKEMGLIYTCRDWEEDEEEEEDDERRRRRRRRRMMRGGGGG